MFHGSIYLNFASAATEFCEAVQFGTDVLIPHHKYQINSWFKPSLIPWFPASCTTAIVHRNQFFCFYQQGKSSESKVKFKLGSNCYKRVLEAAKLSYANKTKQSITPQRPGS